MKDSDSNWAAMKPYEMGLPKPTRRAALGLVMGATAALLLPSEIGLAHAAITDIRKPRDPNSEKPVFELDEYTPLGRRYIRYEPHLQEGDLITKLRPDLIEDLKKTPAGSGLDYSQLKDPYLNPELGIRTETYALYRSPAEQFQLVAGIGTPETPFGVALTRPLDESEMRSVRLVVATWNYSRITDFAVFDDKQQILPYDYSIRNSAPVREPALNELLRSKLTESRVSHLTGI